MHDERAEKDYLAACLLEPATLEACGIPPSSMASGDHRFALGAMLTVRASSVPLDTVSLRTELQRLGWGAERALVYSLGLTEHIPPSPLTVAARIRTLAEARRIAQEASEGLSHAQALDLDAARERLASASYGGTSDAVALTEADLMEEAATAWYEVTQEASNAAKGIQPAYVSLRLARTPLPAWSDGTPRARPTVRLGPGEMLAVGAATGVGKSSIAITELLDLSDRGIPAGLITLEDAPAKWGGKIIGHRGGLNTGPMWKGAGSKQDWDRAMRAVNVSAATGAKYRVMHAKTKTIDEVCRCAVQLVRVHGCRFVEIDYLQKIQAPNTRYTNRRDITDYIIGRLGVAFAILGIPWGLFSQLSRAEKGGNRFPEPYLADFKESGDIENSAAAALMLWIKTDDPDDPRYGYVHAKLAKDKEEARGERWCMRRGHGQVLYEVEAPAEQDGPSKRRGF